MRFKWPMHITEDERTRMPMLGSVLIRVKLQAGGAFRKTRNIASSDGNSSENTKGIDVQ